MFFPFRDLNPTRHSPVATYALVAINVLAFLMLSTTSPDAERETVLRRGFIPARVAQFVNPDHEVVVEIPRQAFQTLDGRIMIQVERQPLEPLPRSVFLTSLMTCMFLHGGWLHLLGNMWFLWIFGNNVEDRLGSPLFLALYLGGGMVGSACHWVVGPNSTVPVIGASGAVAAVLGAYAITWPWARIQTLMFLFIFVTVIDVPALLVLGVWFIGQLMEAMKVTQWGNRLNYAGGVAWWAHIGGFLAGMFLMPRLSELAQLFGRGAPRIVRAEVVDEPNDDRPYEPRY